MLLRHRPQLASHRNLSHLVDDFAIPHKCTTAMKFSSGQQCTWTTNVGGEVLYDRKLHCEAGRGIANKPQSRFNENCKLTVSSFKATEWGQKFASLDRWHSLRFLVFSKIGPRLSYLLVHVPYTSVYEEKGDFTDSIFQNSQINWLDFENSICEAALFGADWVSRLWNISPHWTSPPSLIPVWRPGGRSGACSVELF